MRLPRETTSERPKLVRTCGAFNILTWKCASPHNGVHFFDISTPKSGPGMVCFVHFDLEMCFAPQLRTRFRHLNFEKWSEHGAFCSKLFFSHLHLLSSHSFSSQIFSLLLFCSLTLPSSAFPSVHIVGSLTSKLPSIRYVQASQQTCFRSMEHLLA